MIDERDLAILEEMQRDGRATFSEVGQRVGLAASSVHDRVRKMEQRGVVTGYGPRVDPSRIGLKLLAFVSVTTSRMCRLLAEDVSDWQEIEEFHSVAGDVCALLKVRTADAAGLEDFLERLRSLPGVERTSSTIVLTTRWERPARLRSGGDNGEFESETRVS